MKDSILGSVIEDAAEEHEMSLKDLTVLSASRDPYRLDTPKNHEIGQWLQSAHNELHDGGRIHLRGLHYKLVGRVVKPDGHPYINTNENWIWLFEKAAKAARYLGYIPWDDIRDARNSPPQIFTPKHVGPYWSLLAGEVELTFPDTFTPRFFLGGNLHRQPWRQIVIAEKQGVEEILLPVCEARQATLCLPSGEITDTMVYDLLAENDGRPIAIHQLGDFDPAGNQMAVSTARKVQALVDTQFPDLRVVVHAPALDLEHCQQWELPNTPLKASEKRAEGWIEAKAWKQTELDAAVALAPSELQKVVDDSLMQYFDTSLARRSTAHRHELVEAANDQLAECLGEEELARIHTAAEEKLDELEELVSEVNGALYVDPDEMGIKEPDTPDVLVGNALMNPDEYPGDSRLADYPLIDTGEDWAEQSMNLIRRKNYL